MFQKIQAFRIYQLVLFRQKLLNQYIIVMIIRTIYRVATNLKLKFYTSSQVNTAEMKFEHFFKKILKANSTIQALRVYNESIIQNDYSDQYFAVTLRILTRTAKKGANDDPQLVSEFFRSNLTHLRQMNLQKLSSTYIRDIIFFYVRYSELFSLQLQQLQPIKPVFRQLISRILMIKEKQQEQDQENQQEQDQENQQEQEQEKISIYFSPLIHSLPFTKKYLPEIHQKFLDFAVTQIKKNTNNYLTNSGDFQGLLYLLERFQGQFSQLQKQLIHLTLQKCKIVTTNKQFDQRKSIAMLLAMIKIKKHVKWSKKLLYFAQQIYNHLEANLMENFSTIKVQSFHRIISPLIHHKRSSYLQNKFFQLISKAVSSEGLSKIDPRIIVLGILYLPKQLLTKYFSNAYVKNVVNMIEHYHLRYPSLFDSVLNQICWIINSKRLMWNESFRLFNIFFNKIRGQEIERKLQKKLLFSLILNTYFLRISQIQQPIFNLNFYILTKVSSQKNFFDYNQADFHKYYMSIWNYVTGQEIRLAALQKQYKIPRSLKKGEVELSTNTILLLLQIKIKLAYLNFSHIEVQNTFEDDYLPIFRLKYHKQKMLAQLLLRTNFSKVHFSTVYRYLVRLYVNTIELQQNCKCLLQERIYQIYRLSSYSISLIYYFYSQIDKKKLIQLAVVHSQLCDAFVKYLYPQLLSLVLNNPGLIVNEKDIVILRKILWHAKKHFFGNQALQLFKQLAMTFEHLLLLENYISFTLHNALRSFIMQTFIFDQEYVINKMQFFEHSLTKKYRTTTLAQQKQKYIAHLKPCLKAYVTKKSRVSFKECVIIIKQSLSQIVKESFKIRFYFELLQNLVQVDIKRLQFFFIILIHFAVQNCLKGLNSLKIKEIIQFFINQRFFSKQFNQQFFQTISRQYTCQYTHFSNLAIYPIQKSEAMLGSYSEEVCINPLENITNFCLIYALVQKPSDQIRQFMAKYVFRYRKKVPFFFKMYLSLMDVQVASKVKIQQVNLQDFIKIQSSMSKIQIEESSINAIFQQNQITTQNWLNIQTLQIQQGIHCQIVRKMIKKIHPQLQVDFIFQKSLETRNTFRKTT